MAYSVAIWSKVIVRESMERREWGSLFVWPVRAEQQTRAAQRPTHRVANLHGIKSFIYVYAQIVFHAKSPVNPFGGDLGHVLIALVCNDAFQRNVTIFYDDMDRRHSTQLIALKRRFREDCAVGRPTDAVVVERERQHLDLVVHRLHTLDLCGHILRFALERRPRHLAEQLPSVRPPDK